MKKYCRKCKIKTERYNAPKGCNIGRCKHCAKVKARAWAMSNPEKANAKAKVWRDSNPEKVKAAYNAYKLANPTKDKVYREANSEKVKASKAAWAKANPDKTRAYGARYRATKLAQTPTMSEEELRHIEYFYLCAEIFKSHTSTDYHVDHVKPLSKGGLHHPINLQVLTAKANLTKGAKWDET
ncbi:HNH endonuclease signature motif containing protein [Shewanella sp.]|uniref:HNH endonuclease signature motif containing protein n=1 Tax=Shewanella sp. TaxID=50422 RepID=UPI001ECB8276|nr:HNH endonuclease signature motif containing protein [Shewanella sp.]NRB25134.1 HNH endonuclease [Shewanella sp.]